MTRLEELGFTLRPQAMTYPGSQVCRFIDFAAGPALEFIEVTDGWDYESFVPPGMCPYCPGICLVDGAGSPATLDAYERDFTDLHPYRLHVGYEGAAGPGWHYLNFGVPAVQDTFIWLTALDTPQPAPAPSSNHTNGVRGVIGLEFNLRASELEGLSRLVGRPFEDDRMDVAGVTVFAAGARADVPRKAFPLRSVVLQADSLEPFHAHTGSARAQVASFMGRPAVRIDTNPIAWDLVITN